MRFKKFISNLMCATLILSNILPATASNIIVNESPMDENLIQAYNEDSQTDEWDTEESNLQQIEVMYIQNSNYSVTIPKRIILNSNKKANYSIKVTGEINDNERVYVSPVDAISSTENIDFYMKDVSLKKNDALATITQNKFYWDSEEIANAYTETENLISAPDLTSGTWKGTFDIEIQLQSEYDHTHTYIDGICTECGKMDPHHTHNYEDGFCTICGEEMDDYYIGESSELSNWDHTFDFENDIVTLNYYRGSETDVVVYANYKADGVIYKTQLANFTDVSNKNYYMFNGDLNKNCRNIETINFSKDLYTNNLTDINHMFSNCQALTNLNLNNFDTSNVTNMTQLFSGCSALTYLDLSSFETINVTNMTGMFQNCKSLISLDLSSFDTSNVTNMYIMFKDCQALNDLNISGFNTKNVTSMQEMFLNCCKITSLDLRNFDTRNVICMTKMFYGCSLLTLLDLSSFDTSNVTDMYNFCTSCPKLETVYVSPTKWIVPASSANYIFSSPNIVKYHE